MKPYFDAVREREYRILDVTLRDGGYLNQWSLDADRVCGWVDFLAALPIHFIELGYVSDSRPLGANGTLCPALLERIRERTAHRTIGLAAMLFQDDPDPIGTLRRRKGLLDLVRIPVEVEDGDKAADTFAFCREEGIPFSINLTIMSAYSDEQLYEAVDAFAAFGPDVFYLADSRGAMLPSELEPLYAALLRRHPGLPFGFHPHDNRSLALINTAVAVTAGARFVDASVAGSGLGGGNLGLEQLLFSAYAGDGAGLAGIIRTLCEHRHLYPDFAADFERVRFHLSGVANLDQGVAQKHRTADELAELCASCAPART